MDIETLARIAERERCYNLLNLTRSEAQLMAGELTAQEWRTVTAILKGIQAKIARGDDGKR